MKKNLLLMLVAAIMVLMVGLMFTGNPTKSLQQEGNKLYPSLNSQINEINQINIKHSAGEITILRQDKQWRLKQADHYPVNLEPLRNLLVSLANTTIIEEKTKNPERYAKLGVADYEKGSLSTQLELSTNDKEGYLSLIVGNQRPARSAGQSEYYVRKTGDAQSWLVRGMPTLELKTNNWLNKRLITFEADDIKQLSIKTNSNEKAVAISRSIKGEETYTLDDKTTKANLSAEKVKQTILALTHLTFDDFSEKAAEEISLDVGFATYTGVRVKLSAGKMGKDANHYILSIQALGDSEESAALNSVWAGRHYRVISANLTGMIKSLDDLTEKD